MERKAYELVFAVLSFLVTVVLFLFAEPLKKTEGRLAIN